MSLTVLSAIGTALAAGLTLSTTQSLPWAGAVVLGGIWAYPKVEEYEKQKLSQRLELSRSSAPRTAIAIQSETQSQSYSGVVNNFNPVLNFGGGVVPRPDFVIDLDALELPAQTQETPPEQVSTNSPLAQRLEWLERSLEDDGATGLLSLVAATPLRVIGPQRSGKSTFVKCLALLRKLYIPEHSIEAWSPDAEEWPQCFELHSSYREMAQRMRAFCQRVEAGKRANRTVIMDEFGSYAANGIGENLLKEAVKLSTMRAAKNGELVVFVLHGATAEYLGEVKGLQTSLQTYKTIYLDTSEDKFGKRSPGSTFRIVSDGQTQTITRPPWLTPHFLLKAFPELEA